MDKKRYILRRGQVHNIEDRMTFLNYDRNRFGDKHPTKKEVVKGGIKRELKMSKNGGWE